MKKINLILLLLFSSIASAIYAQNQPNIIWIMAEDIGPDIECYGMQAVKTPELNQLAESGMKFTRAYCTNPICSPSRSAMMTGVHQNKINAHNHRSNRNVPLPEAIQPFTYHLRNAGYTCILGNELVMGKGRKIDVNFKSKALGSWDGKKNFGLFDKLDKFTPEDQPFFAQIQLVVTHRGDWWDEIREKSTHPVNPNDVELPPYMADHPTIRLDWAKYLDQIEYADHEIGLLIDDLKKKGMYENTILIFIGDNGRCNIRGKGYLYDPGLHIPLIVNWPNGIKSGQERNEVVSTTDITASILDLAGIKVPEYMTGKSFMKKDFNREYVYSARDLWDEIMEKSRSLSSKKYKYINNQMPEVPWDAHQAYLEFYRPAVHVMRKLKYEGKLNKTEAAFFSYPKPLEELYDLENDPHETNNLATSSYHQDILLKMRKECAKKEAQMTAKNSVFNPIYPKAPEILDWIKYKHTSEYLKMLDGEEIGFQKYGQLYRKEQKQ